MANTLFFTGRVASAPVLTRPNGATICKFTLMRNEYTGKDEQGIEKPERVVSIQFTAFDLKAENISKHVLEGDQIIIEARIENNNYSKEGVDQYGFNFIVSDFEFSAPGPKKRASFAENNS